MLRMNHTNNDLEYFFGRMDDEFQTLEKVIKNALAITDAYEKEIESSKKINEKNINQKLVLYLKQQ